MDVDGIVAAVVAGGIPQGPLVAALPMYDWPEERAHVDAQWVRLRDAFRAKGVDAPERLARSNKDLPAIDLPHDEFDLEALWRHPNLLVAQTCWGPMELWLGDAVRVVGQDDYSGIEGGDGALYSSAIVMRKFAVLHDPDLVKRLGGLRLAYNVADSMSGYLALERELEARHAGLDIFSEMIASGGHRKSIRMVASGEADVAAVDAKTWSLALRHEATARELVVVGWTQKRLGLPFITGLPNSKV